MRGHRKFNFPVFDAVADALRAAGHTVDNPAAHDRETQPGIEQWDGFAEGDVTRCPLFDYATAMQWDLACVAQAEGIVMLPGWETSVGARIERFVAEHTGSRILLAEKYRGGGGLIVGMRVRPWYGWTFYHDDVRERMSTPTVHISQMDVQHG